MFYRIIRMSRIELRPVGVLIGRTSVPRQMFCSLWVRCCRGDTFASKMDHPSRKTSGNNIAIRKQRAGPFSGSSCMICAHELKSGWQRMDKGLNFCSMNSRMSDALRPTVL